MKVLVIGAGGTIGKAVVAALKEQHEVIGASRNGGDVHADLADAASIRALFERVGKVDAVVSAAGAARFKPLADLTDDDFAFSLANKLMGQVNLARIAADFVNEGGSITLTAGSLAQEPSVGSGAVSLVNAGLEGFGRAAALELEPKGIRVNVVSPPWVAETLEAMGKDPKDGQPAAEVAKAYVRSVENASLSGAALDPRKPGP